MQTLASIILIRHPLFVLVGFVLGEWPGVSKIGCVTLPGWTRGSSTTMRIVCEGNLGSPGSRVIRYSNTSN